MKLLDKTGDVFWRVFAERSKDRGALPAGDFLTLWHAQRYAETLNGYGYIVHYKRDGARWGRTVVEGFGGLEIALPVSMNDEDQPQRHCPECHRPL